MHQPERSDQEITRPSGYQTTELPDQQTNLLCVLDWGLGHATRSLALAGQLRSKGEVVHFATSGRAKQFLEKVLPGETIHQLPSYKVRYPSGNMPLNVAWQLPKWLLTILRERRATAALVRQLGVDRVISDSRFGCYHHHIPSVMLTHQLHPITNNRLVSWVYRKWLQRFTEYWVPDDPDQRLSGKLSDKSGYQSVKFIGPLSRLEPTTTIAAAFDCFALLSGPEPMRSRLEEELLPLLLELPGKHVLVRGVPSNEPARPQGNTLVVDFADAAYLAAHLPAARWVICRAGYSTLMDLAALGVSGKRLFIPTPGQTEQFFLARTQVQSGMGEAVLKQGRLAGQLVSIKGKRIKS